MGPPAPSGVLRPGAGDGGLGAAPRTAGSARGGARDGAGPPAPRGRRPRARPGRVPWRRGRRTGPCAPPPAGRRCGVALAAPGRRITHRDPRPHAASVTAHPIWCPGRRACGRGDARWSVGGRNGAVLGLHRRLPPARVRPGRTARRVPPDGARRARPHRQRRGRRGDRPLLGRLPPVARSPAVAGLHEVHVSDLREGARRLADDATEVVAARDGGSRAAADAAGSVDGGLLAAASRRLAAAITSAGSGVSTALDGAGTNLASSADRYQADDTSAADGLQAVDLGIGPW